MNKKAQAGGGAKPAGDRPASTSLVSPIFFSVLFGFAAGAVGMMFMAAYFLPTPEYGGSSFSIIRSQATQLPDEYGKVPTPVEAASRSMVLFFRSKPRGQGLLNQAYLPQEALAAGTVITSDGWLVSAADIFEDGNPAGENNLVAAVGAKIYAVQQIVSDPYTGAVFLKIDASNLAVAAFNDSNSLEAGDALFAYDVLRGAHRVDYVGLGRVMPKVAGDYVQSSEKKQLLLRFSSSAEVASGSMLVDGQGAVIGLLAGEDAAGSFGVSLRAFDSQLRSVLRDKTTVRSVLGVHYVDLSQVVSGDNAFRDLGRGALLQPTVDGRSPAIVRGGPAALAGLKSGDVIAAVNDLELSAQRPLSDAIADYDPGAEVTLAVRRGDSPVELKIKVVLGSSVEETRD